MGKSKRRSFSKCSGETLPKNIYEKCCGNCLCCKETENQELQCTKHKIRTEFVNLCYAWKGKENCFITKAKEGENSY